jgi:hypothetical protein
MSLARMEIRAGMFALKGDLMKTLRTVSFVLLAAAYVLSAADGDSMIGTWKLNTAKSKFSPGPAPKSQTMTYSWDGDWLVAKFDTIAADGKTASSAIRYRFDGKEYPFQTQDGSSGTVAAKMIDANTTVTTRKFGTNTQTGRTVIAKDGKSLRGTNKGTNAAGKPIDNDVFYEKQ